jgi:hypothetical protein
MKDVTDADLKSSGTKLVVSKVQGRSRPFDESSGTSLSILPFQNLAKPSYHATYDPRCHHFDDVGHRGIASGC